MRVSPTSWALGWHVNHRFEIDTAENDARVGCGRAQADRHLDAGMQADASRTDHCLECSLL
jgi:hypothetical protein